MRKIGFLALILALLTSCGARKQKFSANYEETEFQETHEFMHEEGEYLEEEEPEAEDEVFSIINFAKDFLGTSYRYGGTNHEGMDCSGLVFTTFSQLDMQLPRSSRDMAKKGEELDLAAVNIGDLLFFQTNRKRKVINHVGLVVELAEQMIYFIHSTSSRGVIISTLDEKYWKEHFVMARRIL